MEILFTAPLDVVTYEVREHDASKNYKRVVSPRVNLKFPDPTDQMIGVFAIQIKLMLMYKDEIEAHVYTAQDFKVRTRSIVLNESEFIELFSAAYRNFNEYFRNNKTDNFPISVSFEYNSLSLEAKNDIAKATLDWNMMI